MQKENTEIKIKGHSKLDLESHHGLLRNNEILNQVQDDGRVFRDDEGRSIVEDPEQKRLRMTTLFNFPLTPVLTHSALSLQGEVTNHKLCHSRRSQSGIYCACVVTKQRDPRQKHSGMTRRVGEDNFPMRGKVGVARMRGYGFTLIEFLIVVLIIGILAAIALPQYQKAVEKARFMQLVTIAKSISTAQQMYYLAHGSYSLDPNELELSFQIPQNSTTVNFPGGYCNFTYSQGLGGTPRVSCNLSKPSIAWQHSYNTNKFNCCSYSTDSFRGDWLCQWVLKTQTPYQDGTSFRCYTGTKLAF